MNRMLLAAAALILAACGQSADAAPPSVAVTNAWCRAAPAVAPAGGCYVSLKASSEDRLVAVETKAADRAEIHTMSVEGGVMRMRELKEGVALKAGQTTEFKPGGLHIMVIKPKSPLTEGSSVTVTLKFAKAPAQTLALPVRAMAAAGGHQH
ncbi:copper chaperone PCu(A)C [Caulobacter segnis]|uniref:copper chaperone PCu(A)C n=1 Tax=Caulobacter segnis TaxID=88688 RepID=UPI00240F41A1|nr:copper chaperone PCu(A)C [Caulobacter segnis]MDG2520796.1 copper chaperone PCu(A)C [Caulobacter segnis]